MIKPLEVGFLSCGRWTTSGRWSTVCDRFDGTPFARISIADKNDVQRAVAGLQSAFESTVESAHERGASLESAAIVIDRRRAELQQVMQTEAGFTTSDASGEISRCVNTLRLCAEEARRLTGHMIPMEGAAGQKGRLGFTLRLPLGVICAITPFNSPLNTVAHKIAPALAAGNCVVLKPSELTPVTATILVEALIEGGISANRISVLHGEGSEVGQWLLEEPAIRFVAFTGSTRAGMAIQERIGLRRSQMELGSIASTIVCPDADISRAVPRIVNAAFRKAGQVCTSVQLVHVHHSVASQLTNAIVEATKKLPFGNPRLPATVVGPMISEASAQRAKARIDAAVALGAQIHCGGQLDRSVLAPTVLSGMSDDMEIVCNEAFAPVLAIRPFADIKEAIARINSSPFGLASGIFTNSLSDALLAARTLKVGSVHVNETSSSRVDQMPFGGTKASGFGQEGPAYAIREMSEERTITFVT